MYEPEVYTDYMSSVVHPPISSQSDTDGYDVELQVDIEDEHSAGESHTYLIPLGTSICEALRRPDLAVRKCTWNKLAWTIVSLLLFYVTSLMVGFFVSIMSGLGSWSNKGFCNLDGASNLLGGCFLIGLVVLMVFCGCLGILLLIVHRLLICTFALSRANQERKKHGTINV